MTSKWIQEDRFNIVSKMIKSLCEKYDLPVPVISHSLPEDPCDYTDTKEIRLHVLNDDSYYEHHARHVFGHYLCGLEQTEISDKVVDLIILNI